MNQEITETAAEALEKKLFTKRHNIYEKADDALVEKIYDFAEGYKRYLDAAKIEREFVTVTEEKAKSLGFLPFDSKKSYSAGDKIYYINRYSSMVLAVIGSEPLDRGLSAVAAHIDCPRLDLKQNPMYEDTEMGYFKTHYYGGIKKYQWTAIPLALHGVFVKKDGERLQVSMGEEPGEPVFTITDLLPHLAKDQMAKSLAEAFNGEILNVLIGSMPFKDDKASHRVKLNLLKLLYDKYGVTEDDFVSAELCMVPAYKAVDVGIDKSLIGAYGQDDRVCAYIALEALFAAKNSKKTSVVILADKEEIGSTGNTGLRAGYFHNFVKQLCRASGADDITCLKNTKCLSADVNAAFDPLYPEVMEIRNCCRINYGGVLTKFTGARGKSETSDASAETVGYFRRLFDAHGIAWQTGELGKVDVGGGGTVAQYLANLDLDVIDFGVGVLSMHSPFEVTSKADVYMSYLAMKVFFED